VDVTAVSFLHPSNKRKSAPLMTGPTFPEIVHEGHQLLARLMAQAKYRPILTASATKLFRSLFFAGAAAVCCFLVAQLDPCQWQEQSSSQDMLAVQFVRIGE